MHQKLKYMRNDIRVANYIPPKWKSELCRHFCWIGRVFLASKVHRNLRSFYTCYLWVFYSGILLVAHNSFRAFSFLDDLWYASAFTAYTKSIVHGWSKYMYIKLNMVHVHYSCERHGSPTAQLLYEVFTEPPTYPCIIICSTGTSYWQTML